MRISSEREEKSTKKSSMTKSGSLSMSQDNTTLSSTSADTAELDGPLTSTPRSNSKLMLKLELCP